MPSAQALHEAILSNSLRRVESLLAAGADPDESPELPEAFVGGNFYTHITKADSKIESRATPLHVAVFNCFYKEGTTEIIQMLVDAGAVEVTAFNIRFWIGHQYCNPGTVSPLDLAFFFQKLCCESKSTALEKAIEIIQEAFVSYKCKTSPTETVPGSVLGTWKRLLLSEKFSDVHFICSDGIVLPAHRCVLAAASPYFSTYFEGPWGEQQKHKDGQWETANSSKIMSAILSFIYTGRLDKSIMQSDALTMLSVASEYDLSGLTEHCVIYSTRLINENNIHSFLEASCLYDLKILQEECARFLDRYLNKDNIKEVLRLAHHHGCDKIKMRCFDFICQNATLVLTDRAIVALATEEPELWDQMTNAISPCKRC